MTISKSPIAGAATTCSGDTGGRIGSSGTGATTFVDDSSYHARRERRHRQLWRLCWCRAHHHRRQACGADGLGSGRLRSRGRRGVVHLREIAEPHCERPHLCKRRRIARARELLDHAIESHERRAVFLRIEADLRLVVAVANDVDPDGFELRAGTGRHERRVRPISGMAQEQRVDRDARLGCPLEREETKDAVFSGLDIGIGAVWERRLVEGSKRLFVRGGGVQPFRSGQRVLRAQGDREAQPEECGCELRRGPSGHLTPGRILLRWWARDVNGNAVRSWQEVRFRATFVLWFIYHAVGLQLPSGHSWSWTDALPQIVSV